MQDTTAAKTIIDRAELAAAIARALALRGVEIAIVKAYHDTVEIQFKNEDGVDVAARSYDLASDNGKANNYTREGRLYDGTRIVAYSARDPRPRCACGQRCNHGATA